MRNAVQSMVGPAVVVTVVIGIVVTGQQPESLSITSVKDGLYYINGVGGNVGVRVTSEGVILVDDKFPRNFSGIEAQLREVTREPRTQECQCPRCSHSCQCFRLGRSVHEPARSFMRSHHC